MDTLYPHVLCAARFWCLAFPQFPAVHLPLMAFHGFPHDVAAGSHRLFGGSFQHLICTFAKRSTSSIAGCMAVADWNPLSRMYGLDRRLSVLLIIFMLQRVM